MENLWDMMVEQFDENNEAKFVEDELQGFRTVISDDNEVERFVTVREGGLETDEHGFPKWTVGDVQVDVLCFNNMKYWTTQDGVIEDEATNNEKKRWLGWDENPELPTFYSTAKEQKPWRECEHRFHLVVGYIAKNKENRAKLMKAKQRFWARYFEAKNNSKFFLRPRDITAVKKLFDQLLG